MTCPRNFSKQEIIAGLKAGRALIVDRPDAPEREDLEELQRQGFVDIEFIVTGSQSSAMRCRWRYET